MKQTNHKQSGMTLIELMVTIAIVGILTAIAIPSYNYYTQTARRSAAKSSLQQVRGLLEQYYTNNKAYTNNLKNLGFTTNPLDINKSGESVAVGSPDALYQVTINLNGSLVYCANNACDYEVVATAMNSQTQDKNGDCAVLWFNSLGQKGSVNTGGTATPDCW